MGDYEYVGDVSFSLSTLVRCQGTYPFAASPKYGDQKFPISISIIIKNDVIVIERCDTRYMPCFFICVDIGRFKQ